MEVGPGPGGITRAILDAQVKEVHVIEKDPRFIPTLKLIQESVGSERLHINIGDCLHFNVSSKLLIQYLIYYFSNEKITYLLS